MQAEATEAPPDHSAGTLYITLQLLKLLPESGVSLLLSFSLAKANPMLTPNPKGVGR